MSAPFEGREPAAPPPEQHSKVKLIRNAKGYPQWEITAAARDYPLLPQLRTAAVEQWRELEKELPS